MGDICAACMYSSIYNGRGGEEKIGALLAKGHSPLKSLTYEERVTRDNRAVLVGLDASC